MSVEIRVPSLGESVTEATVAKWFKQVGEPVNADEPIVELETDKVTLEFNAPASGTLAEIMVEEGGEVEVGALLGSIAQDGGDRAARRRPRRAAEPALAGDDGGDGRATARLSPAVRKLLEEHGLDPARSSPRAAPRATSPRATCWRRSRRELRSKAQPAEARAPARRGRPAETAAGGAR